ncbi:MAG: hypothetical protein RSD22_06630 [Romboutsia sp.]
MKKVSSEIPQQAFKDLGESFKKFFRKDSSYPKFKKKGKCETSFFHLNNKFALEVEDETKEVKILNKKLKRLQRQISRKYDVLKSGTSFKKGEKHQTTNTIVKSKPYRVVVEDITYICSNEECNLVIDRDKNASINLANYKLA